MKTRILLAAAVVCCAAQARAQWPTQMAPPMPLPDGVALASDTPGVSLQEAGLIGERSLVNDTDHAAPSCTSNGACGENCCCEACCCPAPLPWLTVYGGAMYMTRERNKDTQLMDDVTSTNVLLRANQFDLDYTLGAEFGVLCHISENLAIEGRYFQIDGWDSTIMFNAGAGGAFVDYAPPGPGGDLGTVAPNAVTATYLSELSNVEVNGRLRIHDRFAFIAGARYMSLRERLTIFQDTAGNDGTHTIRGINDLFGPQIGAEAQLCSLGMLSIDAVVKAGALTNSADNSVFFTGINGGPRSSAASKSRMAFLGEVELSSTLQITHWLAATGGFQGMWLEGVALAPGQVPVSNPGAGTATVNMDGSLFYHGGFLRLEGSY